MNPEFDPAVGDLVAISFPGSPNGLGIYLSPDYAASWRNGEEECYARGMVLWDGDVISISLSQMEVVL